MTSADQAVHVADARNQAGLKMADQDPELLDPVLHRSTGQEQDPVDRPRPHSRTALVRSAAMFLA